MGMRQIKVDRNIVFYTLMIRTWTLSDPQLNRSLYLDDRKNQALFIHNYLQPQFAPTTNPAEVRTQYHMKESLRYCLNVYDAAMDDDFLDVWQQLIEFSRYPTDRYGFLCHAWELLFPDEPWQMDALIMSWYVEVTQ
ncbi:hypothetical protein [Herpetosiphon geysericola]|uniref:Uncharacterized protein n=1 Tax=Herpetosiphon geysericola TaxID=70996 RepID=A0A0P6Z077_9CHLR|nr:hypothetical protein [Herpetosiphon geysericola]KPL90197.1 hypothetical protein SE18_08315 [Herpetosiphon geysericola]